MIRLEQNYRSTQTILKVADTLIQNNRGRKHKTLWTENDAGDAVRVVRCTDEQAEAAHVVDEMQRLHEQGLPWGGMATFYRMNSLSRVMEDELRDRGVPYQIARGTAFYDRKEIKDAVAYLRTIANPADEVNLLRVINTPSRGISAATIKTLQVQGVESDRSVDALMGDASALAALNTRAQAAVTRFADRLRGWREEAGIVDGQHAAPAGLMPPTLREFVELVVRESGLQDHYRKDKSDVDEERVANLGELVSSAQQYETRVEEELMDEETGEAVDRMPTLAEKLLGFLEQVSLVSDVDAVDTGEGQVTLMTLHAAKGLEFPMVAMIGMEDGLLPHDRANHNPDELEEERRLAFVGITRAERHLMLTHARQRTIFGQRNVTIPSRFLGELPQEALEHQDQALASEDAFVGGYGGGRQRDRATQRAGKYQVGQRVRHPQFGEGWLRDVTSQGAHSKARVQFDRSGTKTLILEYARLDVVGQAAEPEPSFEPVDEPEAYDDLPF